MGTLLGSLAFALFIFAQVAAVVAVQAERKSRRTEALDSPHFDHLTRFIRNSGG